MGNFTFYKRKDDPRQLTNTQDVPGAQTGTLKKFPDTSRCTNPLRPIYDVPGHTESQGPFDGKDLSSMHPANVSKRQKEDPKKATNLAATVQDQKGFKSDMGKFYDVPHAQAQRTDLNQMVV